LSFKDIPFLGNFDHNPAGIVIALFMTFLMILWFGSNGTGPFTGNSSYTNSFQTVYNNTKWLLQLTISFLPIIMIIGFVSVKRSQARQRMEEEESEDGDE